MDEEALKLQIANLKSKVAKLKRSNQRLKSKLSNLKSKSEENKILMNVFTSNSVIEFIQNDLKR